MNSNREDNEKKRAVQGVGAVRPEPFKIGASTPYDFTVRNLTAYGGLLPVATMLEKLGFQRLVENPGARWDVSPRLVHDHDFRSDSTGVAIPYGIYDLLANRGSVTVGVSHDTSAFAGGAIAHLWRQEGSVRYPRSRELLILSDTGGSNGARRHTWKTELRSQLADSLGLTLTVAHYPTGASKWNPIEHRLFSDISKNWAGEPLDSYQKILNFIRSTKTQTGLSVTLASTGANIPQALNRRTNNSNRFDCSRTRFCPSGTIRSHRIRELVFASALS